MNEHRTRAKINSSRLMISLRPDIRPATSRRSNGQAARWSMRRSGRTDVEPAGSATPRTSLRRRRLDFHIFRETAERPP
jgi:hypothetical protein